MKYEIILAENIKLSVVAFSIGSYISMSSETFACEGEGPPHVMKAIVEGGLNVKMVPE